MTTYVEKGAGDAHRYLYVHNRRLAGVSRWHDMGQVGDLPAGDVDAVELVEGLEVTLFWLGGGWVSCTGLVASRLSETHYVDVLSSGGLDRSRCYALVRQIEGECGAVVASKLRFYVYGCWEYKVKDGLVALVNSKLPALSSDVFLAKTFNAAERTALLHSLATLTKSSCVRVACRSRMGDWTVVENKQLARMQHLGSEKQCKLVRQVMCERGLPVVYSPELGQVYHSYVTAVWGAYMRKHVWRTRCHGPGMDQVLVRIHGAYVSRIGTVDAPTTLEHVADVLSQMPPLCVERHITTWLRGLSSRPSGREAS